MKRKLPLWLFWIIVCFIYCSTVTIIEFSDQPVGSFYSLARTGMLYGLVSLATCALLAVVCAWRAVFAIVFPLLAAFSGGMCFLALTIGSRLSETSLEIALENDAEMWFSVISPALALTVLASLALGIILAFVRWKRVSSTPRASIIMAAGGAIIAVGSMVASPKSNLTIGSRLPYSIYCSTAEYLASRREALQVRTTYADTPVRADSVAPDVIFVLGESLRADHLPMNGYRRNTLPTISADSLLINFPNYYTEFTNTNHAVPALMTSNPEKRFEEQSFITLFKNAGYRTAWFANQNLTRFYSYFANEADTLVYCNDGKSVMRYQPLLDTDMLPAFRQWLNSSEAQPRLAVLHCIGSHWWYPLHYTRADARFTPEITHKEIAGLNRDEIINSYDNTILATDRFLAELREIVGNRNAIIVFVSDHGELLGEDGCYLHDGDQEPLHHPAAFMLPTATYAATYPALIDSLRAVSPNPVTSASNFKTLIDVGRLIVGL